VKTRSQNRFAADVRNQNEGSNRRKPPKYRKHFAGVEIAFGTDAAVYPRKRIAVYVQIGMTPLQAINGLMNAADLLGWMDRVGTLERSCIIAVNGDPLKDVTLLQSPVMVMKGGTVSCRNSVTAPAVRFLCAPNHRPHAHQETPV
jgi:imidazolonepropionase-like amidohydrolase